MPVNISRLEVLVLVFTEINICMYYLSIALSNLRCK